MKALSIPLALFLPSIIFSFLTTPTLSSNAPLLTYCSSDGNYTSPGSYTSNIHDLLTILISTTPKTANHFFYHNVGAPNTSRAFGLAQCRPDVSPTACADCLSQAATAAANKSCPVQKSASIRYDYCVLRYADYSFSSVLEYPTFNLTTSPENASNPSAFGQQVGDMLAGLLVETKSSPLRIAAGEVRVKGDNMIYGLAWCTIDLDPATCYQCLDHVLQNLEGYRGYKICGQSMTVSCIVSYNNFSFFDVSLMRTAHPPPPPTPAETSKR